MSLVPFKFNNTKLVTITINGKHWTRARETCGGLEYEKKTGDVIEVIVTLKIYGINTSWPVSVGQSLPLGEPS